MPHAPDVPEPPEEVWDGLEYTSIHAAVLFADLQDSVLLSGTLPTSTYQHLINACQRVMLELIDELKELGMFVAECNVAGDQLSVFFYDPKEVHRNYRLDGPAPAEGEERKALIADCRSINERIVFDALRAAIMLKNKWLTQDFNMERVRDRKEPIGIGIGMHTGRVHLCNRPDGRCRIEGYAVNLAKRIESYSRSGKYSRIMLSQDAQDVVRGSVRAHTMLRQRIFFHTHEVPLELLKGITRSKKVCELKFFVRIGVKMPPGAVEQYEALFALDPNNVWAYYQLYEHYAFVEQDWERVLELAKRAHLVHPRDEKVLLDLSRCYFHAGSLRQARRFALQALQHNEEFDLAYERLATIAEKDGVVPEQVEYMSKAVALAPGSPVNHLNYGLVLCEDGRAEEGTYHLLEALRLFPGYAEQAGLHDALRELAGSGKLPPAVKEYMAAKGVELGE